MYIKKIDIKNFRGISNLSVKLNQSLNVFVGENNSGKSAIIDAIRICYSYGSYPADIFIKESDFHIDVRNGVSQADEIAIDLFFFIEGEDEGVFHDLLSIDEGSGESEGQLHFVFKLDASKPTHRIKKEIWGGDNKGHIVPGEVLELLHAVYLGALRDAVSDLRPKRGSRIGKLFSGLESDETKQQEISSSVTKSLESNKDWIELLTMGKDKVDEHLKSMTLNSDFREISISALPFDFKGLVDGLNMTVPYKDSKGEVHEMDIFQNGLGYNNLIYSSTVLGDLDQHKKASPHTCACLLIEEPEAHLHPQAQNIFFEYISGLKDKSYQTFVTSHSPTITSKAEINSLIIVKKSNDEVSANPLACIDLDENNSRDYLRKFLDTTKSQLFFGRNVLFVEGISEALLLPVFAKKMGSEYCLEKNGIEVVNVNGVAFSHFGKLFNAEDEDKRLNCKASIVTDGDERKYEGDLSPRARNAKKMERGNLKVFLAKNTFEYELFLIEGNRNIMLEVYKELHPIKAKNVKLEGSNEEQAKSFLEQVETDKSEFAHSLSISLSDESKSFEVPAYLQDAIKNVI